MTEFEKQVYTDMSSADRILLWMMKCSEFMEFSEIMTEADIRGLHKVLSIADEEDR